MAPEGAFSFNLHVLGLPPAFVLSQDQTLKLKSINAYPWRSNLCTSLIGCSNRSKLFVASVTKVTESRQTVKLTLHHRVASSSAICRWWSIERTKLPTYLFCVPNFQITFHRHKPNRSAFVVRAHRRSTPLNLLSQNSKLLFQPNQLTSKRCRWRGF